MIKKDTLRFFISALLPSFILRDYLSRLKVDCDSLLDLRKFLLFRWLLKEGDFAIDVGAHVGSYTKFFAKMVGKSGTVSAFEPNPYVFHILKKQTKNMNNVHLHQMAVSCHDGKRLKLKFHPFSLAQSSTIEESLKNNIRMPGITREKEVLCCSIDRYCKAVNKPVKFIKIDAEGHDDAVIESALNVIKKDRPYLMCEVSKDSFENMRHLKSLLKLNYSLIDVATLQPADVKSMDNLTDILAAPGEYVEDISVFLEGLRGLH